jgi:hypothetical protein
MRLNKGQIKNLRNILIRIIKRDLIDKKNIAMMLSSGIDSRTVACILKYAGFNNVVCVTVDFKEARRAKRIADRLGFKHIVTVRPLEQQGNTKWICLADDMENFDCWIFGRGFNEVFKNNNRYIAPGIDKLREKVEWYNMQGIPYYAPILDPMVIDYLEDIRKGREINHFYTCKGLIKNTYPSIIGITTNTGFNMRLPDLGHRGIKWFCKKLGVKLR